MDNIIVHKKKRFFNKLKQNTERFLIFAFMVIGLIATLNFAINVGREWGEWYFHERIIGGVVEAQAKTVPFDNPDEALSVNSEREEYSSASPLPLEIDEVIHRIAILESSDGKNQPKYCTDRNLINKWGYGIYGNRILCFKSDEEGRREISRWFQECTKKYVLENCICRYNTGTPSLDCGYLQKFNSIT